MAGKGIAKELVKNTDLETEEEVGTEAQIICNSKLLITGKVPYSY